MTYVNKFQRRPQTELKQTGLIAFLFPLSPHLTRQSQPRQDQLSFYYLFRFLTFAFLRFFLFHTAETSTTRIENLGKEKRKRIKLNPNEGRREREREVDFVDPQRKKNKRERKGEKKGSKVSKF